MKKHNTFNGKKIVIIFLNLSLFILFSSLYPSSSQAGIDFTEIGKKVRVLMKKGHIPGLSLVLIDGDKEEHILGFGYADLEKKIPVTGDTMFELASCSKAFTGLAALQLEAEGLIDFDKPVSTYLPWFFVKYKNREYRITLRQLLYHTSGIPWETVSDIPQSNSETALKQTVKNLVGIELSNIPGRKFQYATVNYDILGAVIEAVTGLSFENYLEQRILQPLGMEQTLVGKEKDIPAAATGYKISFFSPRKYSPPVFRGNNPAGYVISNARDIGRWLKLQMGLVNTQMDLIIKKSHEHDRTTIGFGGSSYAFGWQVSLNDLIEHAGMNPNFSAYIGFKPGRKIGVAVLANANSVYTTNIGKAIMNHLDTGAIIPKSFASEDSIDKISTLGSFVFGFYLLCVIAYLVITLVDIFKKRREFADFFLSGILKFIMAFILLLPFLYGVYLLPGALANFSWASAAVWAPLSFHLTIILILAAIGLSYFTFFVSALFPHKNKYLKNLPILIVLSLLSGWMNAAVIFLITTSLYSGMALFYQVYYYTLAFCVYIWGRKILQTRLVKLTLDIVYDWRVKLIAKIFLTSYQKFEKIDRGRIYATLNDDTGQIGNSANILIGLITSIITAIAVFLYLASIAFSATLVTLGVVIAIATLYYRVNKKARVYFEAARDTRNVYMRLLNGLLDGFKELSLKQNKRNEYEVEIRESCDQFRQKQGIAVIKFINAFLIGESLLIIVLGSVSFALPRLFPDIERFILMSFIIALLYLIGPVNGILNSIPAITQLKVAWDRIRQFLKDIPANINPEELKKTPFKGGIVENIRVDGVEFVYKNEGNGQEDFVVGPVNFEANKGEVIFIIGGNGSGKTTIAKLITGLYVPGKGNIEIDGKPVGIGQLGEYYSIIFNDYHLFEKLYDVDLNNRGEEIKGFLELLGLKDKVEIKDDKFSSINLSAGQRKRLAILQCYLENSPIYLFDEVAAGQDPEFRRFFYRELLVKMKESGKIVIAITHDDHYFDMADKIIKMNMGKIETMMPGVEYKIGIGLA